MAKRKVKSAVTAHGRARDGSVGAARFDSKLFFDARQEFLHEKIFVPNFAVVRIDVKRSSGSGGDDQKFGELFSFPGIFHEIPAAGMNKHLFVVAESVKEIKNRKVARFIRIVAGWKKNAVRNGARKDFAGQRIALDAAGCGVRERRQNQKHQD